MLRYDTLAVTPKVTANEAVAIVGIGAILPDALNTQQFWQNVLDGKYSIGEVPPSRWSVKDYYDPDPSVENKSYCKIGAFIKGFRFNSIQFKIPPRVAEVMDNVQLWTIVAAHEALSDAGYLEKDFNGARTGVIFGNAIMEETLNRTSLRVNLPLYINPLFENEDFISLPEQKRRSIISSIERRIKDMSPRITEDTMPGELSNVIAGRVANTFNLRGTSFTTDAACASSLAAINAAFGGLQRGEYDTVVTGGVDRSMSPSTFIKFCKIGALSADGSYPFDERAGGFVMGEGCAVFVMKRYSDALRDGDRVYAVIASIGTSSDGKGKSITAPNIDGQLLSFDRAYESAGVDPREIDMIEAHGTATKVGDVIEMEAMGRLMSGRDRRNPVRVTSVKSQIGHLKAAAGAASLAKAALSLHHKKFSASINYEKPNPNIDWDSYPVKVQVETEDWEKSGSHPRRAGLSSFGFGGTNFHLVMQEAEDAGSLAARSGRRQRMKGAGDDRSGDIKAHAEDTSYYKFAFGLVDDKKETFEKATMHAASQRGETQGEEKNMEDHDIIMDMLDRARFMSAGSLDELTRELLDGRKPEKLFSLAEVIALREKGWRLAVTGKNESVLEERLGKLLDAARKGLDANKISFLRRQGIYVTDRTYTGVGFLYPGQGSQSMNMLATLQERYQAFREIVERADRVMEPLVGAGLSSLIYTDAPEGSPEREKMEERLRQTEITQPAMLTVDYAMTKILGEMGIHADFVTGHSLGEYGALVAAGSLKFENSLEIVAARGREMASVSIEDTGMMFASMADAETTEKLLAKVDGYLLPANKNSYRQTVVAGSTRAVKKAMEVFEAEGVRAVPLKVSHAFHSKIVAGAIEPLKKVLSRYEFKKPLIPIFGNVTGEAYPMDAENEYFVDILGRQIASTVEFIKCLTGMYAAGARFFVEVGPRKVLTSFADDVLPKDEIMVTCANNHRQEDLESLAGLFGAAAVAGAIRLEPALRTGREETQAAAGPAGPAGTVGPVRRTGREETQAAVGSASPAGTVGPVRRTGREETESTTRDFLAEVLELVSEKTGYPADMLDPAMDMEADLGIDTVKQAELFSLLRKKYDIPKQENLKLKDYPTINHVAGFVAHLAKTDVAGDSVPDVPDAAPGRKETQATAGPADAPQKGQFIRIEIERKGGVPAEPGNQSYRNGFRGVHSGTPQDNPAGREETQPIMISGTAVGLPGMHHPLFSDDNFNNIFEGKNFIDNVAVSLQEKFLGMNIVKIDKGNGDEFLEKRVDSTDDVIKLAGRMGSLDLVSDYGVDKDFTQTMDDTAKLAAAAGLEALRDAGIPLVVEMRKTTTGVEIPIGWYLPRELRDDTGVIFASAFPGYNKFAEEIEKYLRHKHLGEDHEFDRKILFGILAMGHTQFAQLIRARGPNLQVNAACASTLIAFSTAIDWIKAGRCKRVIVLSSDNASSDRLLPWIGGGFLASGGAATDADVKDAAIPFDRRRHGLIVGMGAAAVVLETQDEVRARGMSALARVINTKICNSAFHGTRLDPEHISGQVGAFVSESSRMLGCSVEELADDDLVFLSHETYTPARGGSAAAEVTALRKVFGDKIRKILIANTKGFTGHPMAVGIEEAVGPRILHEQRVPPVANISTIDTEFDDLNLSRGGSCSARRVMRFAAGFGSQVAMALLERDSTDGKRVTDEALHASWLAAMVGAEKADVFLDGRVLKMKPEGAADSKEAIAAAGAVVTKPAGKVSEVEVRKKVIAIIAEKTGYPVDMLDPEMDMEADLGIDTVKQAELFSIVRKTFNISKVTDLKLKDYPTINHVTEFIHGRVPVAAAASSGVGVPPPAGEAEEAYVDTPVDESLYETVEKFNAGIKKTVVRWLPPAPHYPSTGLTFNEGDTVVIHGGGRFRDELEKMFSQKKVRVIDAENTDWRGISSPVRGIIFFEDGKQTRVPSPEDLPFHCEIVVNEAVKRLEVLQGVAKTGKFAEDEGFIIGVTFSGAGQSVSKMSGGSVSSGALTGFVKSLAFEFPGCVVKAVDFDTETPADEAAALLMGEIMNDRRTRELGFFRGTRWMLDLENVKVPETPEDAGKGRRKIYMVTGAGGAVMTDVVRKIATMKPADFVLLDIVKPEMTGSGKWSKRFGKIMSIIEYIEEKGGSALYVTADITDPVSVSQAVKSALVRHGGIDIVIHGAGIERSRSVLKKTHEEFSKIVSIKVRGAGNLLGSILSRCRPEKFIFFSSVAGRFGNAGQADYSTGNDFMAKLAAGYGSIYPDVDMLAVDWTAWDGEGMAGNDSVRAVLEEAGIEMLSRREGVDILWRLAGSRSAAPELVVSGKLGFLEEMFHPAGKDEVDMTGAGEKDSLRGGGGGSRRRLTLSPASQVYLWDHAVDGIPVFPAVKGLEVFHDTCRAMVGDGWRLVGIREASFLRAVKFFSGRARDMFVQSSIGYEGNFIECRCRLETEDRNRMSAGGFITNFEADLLFDYIAQEGNGNGNGNGRDILITRSDGIDMVGAGWDDSTAVQLDEIYRFLFHKNQFQVVSSFCLAGERDDCGLGCMKVAPRANLSGIYMLVEFGMQSAGLYLLRTAGVAALPLRIKSVNILGEVSDKELYRAIAIYRGMEREGEVVRYGFDISIRDQEGSPVMWIDNLELIRTDRIPEAQAAMRRLPQNVGNHALMR